MEQEFARLAAQLEAIDGRLGELSAPDAGLSPSDRSAVVGACAPLRPEIARLRALTADVSAWSGGALALARLDARVTENLTLAELALDRLERTAPEAETLYAARDAAFHAGRALDLIRQLEREVREQTRQIDREENRREFMSG